jgi:MFS family permease
MNLAALGHRDFRAYLAGNLFALNGMWLQRVTLGWLAWDLTRQAGFVGLIAFLSFAPTMISGPFFGVVADRVDVRRAAIATQSALAVITAGLLATYHVGVLGPLPLAGLAASIGVVTSAHHPIRMTLAPSLVEHRAIASVIALTSFNFNLARLTGPAIGGWLIATWGVGAALGVNLVCFLPLIAALLRIRPRPRETAPEPELRLAAALSQGVRHATGQPLIRRAMLLTALFSLIGRGVLEILPALADGLFGRGPAGLGALTAAAGAGALAASVAMALGRGQAPGHLPRRSLAAAVAGLAVVLVLGRTTSWPAALALVALLGLAGTLVGVSLQSAVQLVLTDAYRGRVMSLWSMVAIGAAALGAIGLGALADAVGLGPALTAAGVAGLAASALFLLPPGRPAPCQPAPPPRSLPETSEEAARR